MKVKNIYLAAALVALAACGQSANGQSASEQAAQEVETAEAPEVTWDAPSGEYSPDPDHRYITFSYLHQGYSFPHVRWGDWTATLNWDSETPEKSTVAVTIDAASVDSGVERFDGHLKGEQFFDVENHPEITFVSTNIERTSGSKGVMTGDLTIKGVTKPVVLDVAFNRGAHDQRANVHKLGFSATGTVKRSDYGVDAYVPHVGDDVAVQIEVEFQKPAE